MFTIFHISDLHFGEKVSGIDESHSLLDKNIKGLEGHDIKIWIAFKNHILSRIKQTSNEFRICVTGDLSRVGRIESFHVASELFFDGMKSKFSDEFGLNIEREKFIIIPGNHDSYDDSIHKRNNLRTFNGIFHSSSVEYPIPQTVTVNNTNFIFLPIDSTYKKNGVSLIKKLGKGIVEKNQFERIKGYLLNNFEGKSFKILLLHHSPIIVDSQHKRSLMLDKSQVTLDSIVKNKIDIVLCGHLHDDFYDILPLKRLVKYLPKRGWHRILKNLYQESHLNDYHIIAINGKKARYFDSIAYQIIKEKHEILDYSKGEFTSLNHFEKYLYSLPEYNDFLEDFHAFKETETALIMTGSTCKEREKENSYMELTIDDDLTQIFIKRHKYNRETNSFDTKERIKRYNQRDN